MKHIVFSVLLLAVVFPCCAYQAGPAGAVNFNSPRSNQLRTLTNQNNRSWRNGVKTQSVKTNMAGSSQTEFKSTLAKPAGKVQAVPVVQPKPTVATQPSTGPLPAAAGAGSASPEELLKQVQGLMQMAGGENIPGLPAQTGAAVIPANLSGSPAQAASGQVINK